MNVIHPPAFKDKGKKMVSQLKEKPQIAYAAINLYPPIVPSCCLQGPQGNHTVDDNTQFVEIFQPKISTLTQVPVL